MSTTTGNPSPSLSLARDYRVMDTLFNDQVAATCEALRMFQAVILLKETATIKVVLEELVNIAVSHSFHYLWEANPYLWMLPLDRFLQLHPFLCTDSLVSRAPSCCSFGRQQLHLEEPQQVPAQLSTALALGCSLR